MLSKDKSSQGIAHLMAIFVILIASIALIVIFLPSTNKTQSKPPTVSTAINNQPSVPDATSDEPQNIGTYKGVPSGIDVKEDWETYVSTRYNYEISNTGEWILFINEYANSDIRLRLKSDETPGRHGFSIAVIENPKYQTMKAMCDNNEISESTGILCSKAITTTNTSIGNTSWEKIEGDGIGVNPSFNIVLSTFNDNKIFYVVSEGYNIEQITEILKSFRFVK